LSLPGKVGLTPYYERRWKEKRPGAGAGLVELSGLALGDLASASPLWTGIPFHELVEAGAPAAFAAATGSGLGAAAEASFVPEAGLLLTREFGSSWLDLLLPSSLSLAYKRELARAGDVVTSTGAWELGAKGAALNLFGIYGAYPLAGFFEEDEYVSTTQVRLARVEGESSTRFKLLRQDLLTFYAKEGRNSLILENRVAAEREPALATWSESLRLALSLTRERHWLLDLYRLVLPPLPAEGEAEAGKPASKLVSGYLADLAGRKPRARTLLNLKTELSGRRGDASKPLPTLSFEESIEGRLTLPDRMTVSTIAALSQRRDGTTAALLLGFTLSLGLTLSF
ncbi:MAG: hypothetical protein JNG85_13465, partial [Spirochaetaceae bacterium]|nr:hypothetical protein [Spirochaetaceae bacterium]